MKQMDIQGIRQSAAHKEEKQDADDMAAGVKCSGRTRKDGNEERLGVGRKIDGVVGQMCREARTCNASKGRVLQCNAMHWDVMRCDRRWSEGRHSSNKARNREGRSSGQAHGSHRSICCGLMRLTLIHKPSSIRLCVVCGDMQLCP